MPPGSQVGHSNTVLLATASAALTLGVIIGVAIMWAFSPGGGSESTEATAASAEPTSSAGEEGAAPSATVAKPRAATPRVTAAQKRLAKLRKKVKITRVKKMDLDCAKYFGKKLPAGYVYQGGKFEENRFVANASGCKAVATASKAPWFCCRR